MGQVLCHCLISKDPVIKNNIYNTVRQDKKRKCSKCDKIFYTMVELRKHVVKVHQLRKSVINHSLKFVNCIYCSLKFSSKVNLRKHLENHTKDIKINRQKLTSKKSLAEVLMLNATMCNMCKVKHMNVRHNKRCNFKNCAVTLQKLNTKSVACTNKACRLILPSAMALKAHKAKFHPRQRNVHCLVILKK